MAYITSTLWCARAADVYRIFRRITHTDDTSFFGVHLRGTSGPSRASLHGCTISLATRCNELDIQRPQADILERTSVIHHCSTKNIPRLPGALRCGRLLSECDVEHTGGTPVCCDCADRPAPGGRAVRVSLGSPSGGRLSWQRRPPRARSLPHAPR